MPFGKIVLQTAVFLLLGLLIGFASKWLDLNNNEGEKYVSFDDILLILMENKGRVVSREKLKE